MDAQQRLQATLRFADGGCSFPSATQAAPAAYAASWALLLNDVMTCLGANSLEEFRARCPRTQRTLDQAEAALLAPLPCRSHIEEYIFEMSKLQLVDAAGGAAPRAALRVVAGGRRRHARHHPRRRL